MKNILIVVDVQNGFTRYEQTKKLSRKIAELTNGNYFDTIIATRFRNKEGSPYTEFLNWHRLIESPDIDLSEGIKADIVIDKWIYTCVDAKFMELLKEQNEGEAPRQVFLCGADTDCCVLKIAVDLFENGVMPLVLTKYCDSNGGPESHAAGLLVMDRLVGKKSLVDREITDKVDLRKIIEERK